MRFAPGNKYGHGRPAGSKNTNSEAIRAKVLKFINADWQDFLKDFKSLTAAQRMKTRTELLDYVLPRLRAVDLSGDLIGALSDQQAADILTELKKTVITEKFKDRLDGPDKT